MSRDANRRRLEKLMSRRRGETSGPRGPKLPTTPEFAEAANRFVINARAAFKELERSGASPEELDEWQPRHTPQGRADINRMLTEIRLARRSPEEAAAEREEMREAEERRKSREEESGGS